MKLTKVILPAFALVVLSMTSLYSQAAEVRSMSRQFVSTDGGVKVTKVMVTCAEVEKPRVIVKVGKSKKWCAKELASLCNKQKVGMAQKVCSTYFDKQLIASRKAVEPVREAIATIEPKLENQQLNDQPAAKPEPVAKKQKSVKQKVAKKSDAQNDERVKLVASKSKKLAEVSAEEEQLLIEQKLLEIKREQLEIRKRELELRRGTGAS